MTADEVWALVDDLWSRRAGIATRPRCPTVHKLAEMIRIAFPDMTVTVEPWSETPNKAPRGVRWRVDGKTRHGHRLSVWRPGSPAYMAPDWSHKTTETYRSNMDIIEWMRGERRAMKESGNG